MNDPDRARPTVVNGMLYFVYGGQFWKSDGTPGGTVPFFETGLIAPLEWPGLFRTSHRVYLTYLNDVYGGELWTSDGTTSGTVLLKDIRPGIGGSTSEEWSHCEVGGTFYFVANDGTHGAELWKSDGTAAGTVLVKDIFPGSRSALPSGIFAIGNTIYFNVREGFQINELWKSDGTEAGTVMVKDFGSVRIQDDTFVNIHGKLGFFTSAREFWQSNGTVESTFLLARVPDFPIWDMAFSGSRLFFCGPTTEMWAIGPLSANAVQDWDGYR